MGIVFVMWTGGVVALLLNHRLIAGTLRVPGGGLPGTPAGVPAQGHERHKTFSWNLLRISTGLRRGTLWIVKLELMQAPVGPLAGQQLCVGSLLHNPARIQHHDEIRLLDR